MYKKQLCFIVFLAFFIQNTWAQKAPVKELKKAAYWNSNTKLLPFRLPPAPPGTKIEYVDLDKDGDPDLLKTFSGSFPVMWVDDDDDMKYGDTEGDTDSDCLMIDRNKDGKYGSYSDLNIDWNDTDGDGVADMQVVVDNPSEDQKNKADGGHYMWVLDTDKDQVFNYIDFNNFSLRAWVHNGTSDFFEDYHGKSMFLKAHTTPDKMNDPQLNWENPFLFYDPDGDGLTEMAIRLIDPPTRETDKESGPLYNLTGKIDWVSLSFDLDNDNNPGNEFDLDMTVNFRGKKGFDYRDQVHRFKNMRGLPAADSLFLDPRWRQLNQLVYPDHDAAWDLIFKRGEWDQVYFTFDEDDDCNRWERVELYEPKDIFKVGALNGGLDNNRQADAAGDRGEWDMDNSGNGDLYIGGFDGRMHLYGAEWGAWRIDQNSKYFQGMGGIYDGYGPGRLHTENVEFATVKYTDTDQNGFIDEISYDLDGDTLFEHTVSLKKLGLSDEGQVIKTSEATYDDLVKLHTKVAEDMWHNAEEAVNVAKKEGLNLSWYALMMSPKSIRQKYDYGYWLQLYIYFDLRHQAKEKGDSKKVDRIDKAYFGHQWSKL